MPPIDIKRAPPTEVGPISDAIRKLGEERRSERIPGWEPGTTRVINIPQPGEERRSERIPGWEPGTTRVINIPQPEKLRFTERVIGKAGLTRKLVVRPPNWYPSSLQRTVLRYDRQKKVFYVDEYVERMSTTGVSTVTINGERVPEVYAGERPLRHIHCPYFNFQVTMVACYYYCASPCRVHMDALQNGGWWQRNVIPPSAIVRKVRKGDKNDGEE